MDDQTYDYVQAVKQAPEQVMEFIRKVKYRDRHRYTRSKDEQER